MKTVLILTLVVLIASQAEGQRRGKKEKDESGDEGLSPKNAAKPVYKPAKKHKQIKNQCKRFKHLELKNLCLQLSSNPVISGMGRGCRGFANDNDEKKYKQARALSIAPDLFTADPPGARSLSSPGYQCDIECPKYNMKRKLGGKTLSPFGKCTHYDPMRFPQWLTMGYCSCGGCINPISGKEDLSFASLPVTINVTIIRRQPNVSFDDCTDDTCTKELLPVIIGCHCGLPRV